MEKPDAITTTTASVIAGQDSPWFSGHFPNNPILPGVAQLGMVADLISEPHQGCLSITGLSRVKFRKLVRPGEQLHIEVTRNSSENHCMFKITSGNEDVCSGKMFFTHNKKSTHS
ncbi:MAG: MaoC/PaaZ C-terminal domain-containing protein [Desulforhopalus sp.]|nr:MaoC/PaaZ C-terminal domain-containing protein [Desulforhopalus sp.]